MQAFVCQLILWLWYLTAPATFAVLGILVYRGLWRRYWALCLFLLFTVVHKSWLLWALWAHGWKGYGHVLEITQSAAILSGLGIAFDGFFQQARHFRRFFWFGTTLLAVVAAVSSTLVYATSGVGDKPYPGVPQSFVWCRYMTSVCLLMLVGADLWFRTLPFAFRPNVQTHVTALEVKLFGAALGNGLAYTAGFALAAIGEILMSTSTFAALALWSRMRHDGEVWAPPPTPTPQQIGETTRALRELSGVVQSLQERL